MASLLSRQKKPSSNAAIPARDKALCGASCFTPQGISAGLNSELLPTRRSTAEGPGFDAGREVRGAGEGLAAGCCRAKWCMAGDPDRSQRCGQRRAGIWPVADKSSG